MVSNYILFLGNVRYDVDASTGAYCSPNPLLFLLAATIEQTCAGTLQLT